jgi:transcriptional regulator with XRE-family HTH domain
MRAKKKNYVTFGELVRRACRRQGVTHSELARRLGVSQSRVPQIMRCDNLTEKVFRDTVRALGLEIDCRLVRREGART